ncbi:MAG: DUF1016 N-terminal domain-containing protein [Elusimicrobiota bacterium]
MKKSAKKNITNIKRVSVVYSKIRNILEAARNNACRAVNFAMTEAYWNIGRLFYFTFPIFDALRQKLSWTHIRTLLPVKDELQRKFYSVLCRKEHWSTRVLRERIDSMLYERTALSRLPEKTIEKQFFVMAAK